MGFTGFEENDNIWKGSSGAGMSWLGRVICMFCGVFFFFFFFLLHGIACGREGQKGGEVCVSTTVSVSCTKETKNVSNYTLGFCVFCCFFF